MKTEVLKAEVYLFLKEKGMDIDACEINYKILSVSCEDLSLYRKALRVKIRALIKLDDMQVLKGYVNALYSLACFAKYLYGFHSCTSNVEIWQEKLALSLQADFDVDKIEVYDGTTWIAYTDIDYEKEYMQSPYNSNLDTSVYTQDLKPFLNLKDKAHFERFLTIKTTRKEKL